jgi:hypothetical protein
MGGSNFPIVLAVVVAVIATVAAAADHTCFPDSDHCRCRRTKAGGTCLRPTGKAGDECIEYQCGEGAVCDCLAGTEICSMMTCSTSRYAKLESVVPKSGGIVKCKKVERDLCVTLDPPAAAGDACINDSSCPGGLICNSANVCATRPAEAGEPCKVDSNCVPGLICNSGNVCATPPAAAGASCKVDANCVSGLICNSGNVCAAPPAEGGEPCKIDSNCVPGLICNSGNVCATPPAAAGEPCKVDANCVSGLICNSTNVCATPPAVAGEPCKVDANCVSGLTCNSANICATPLSNIGGPCSDDAACKDGLTCHTLTSTCAKKTEFTMRINVDDEGWFQVGIGNGPEKDCGNLYYRYYDHSYTGPCGDMFITINNMWTHQNPTGLALEITEGGIKYTLMPDSDPSPNKLTALVKYNARPFDHMKDGSYDYSANGWTPAVRVLRPPGLLGPGSNAPQLSVSTNAVAAPGLWMWKISLPFCAGGFSAAAVPTVLKHLGASCTDGVGGDADCAVGLYCSAQICSTTP